MNHDDFKIYRAIALFAYIQAHPDLAPETVSKRSGDIAEACCRDDERRFPAPEVIHGHRWERTGSIRESTGRKVQTYSCYCGAKKHGDTVIE